MPATTATKTSDTKAQVAPIGAKTEHAMETNTLQPYSGILRLQRAVGNRAVNQLIQAKLNVSVPGDQHEVEADRVADQIMRMPRTGLAFGIGAGSRPDAGSLQGATIQTKASAANSQVVSENVGTRINASRGSGSSLPGSSRQFFESRFGNDFSQVRVHTGDTSASLASSVSARAFTVGRNIFFGSNEYSPGTFEGQRLIAHELAHVVQQSSGLSMIQRAVALTDDDYKALAEQLYKAMKGLGTDEEAIYAALQKLDKDAAAITKLKEVYKKNYKGADLEAEIRSEMSGKELRFALELIGIKDDPKSADIVGKLPTTDDEYKAVAKKLYAAMKGLGTDEEAIYGLLLPFNRDEPKLTKLKTIYQSELKGGLTGKGLEADIKDEMSSDELAYALYLLNAPPPAANRTTVTVSKPGTEAHTGKVEGGEVSVHTGTQYTPTAAGAALRPEGFSLGYKGGLASETRWLQFIWREIVVNHPTKGEYHVKAAIGTSAKHGYSLTTDRDKPTYNTDSADADNPFYEAGFFSNRTADAMTMFDQPAAIESHVRAAFSDGATKVTSRAHFNTFLIRDYKTLYHVYLQVEWTFNSAAASPNVQTVKSAGKADSLPSDMKEKLVEQYPKFDYIQ
jgi:hypothetical protein